MQCPSCDKPTKQQELDANRGVCAACRKEFAARAMRPQEEQHRRHAVDTSRVSFVDGHVEQFVEFPFQQVEQDLDRPLSAAEDKAAALAVGKFCGALFEAGGSSRSKFFQAAHAFAFACGIHPEQDKPGEAIARKFGITTAGFFKQVNHIRDRLNLPRLVAGTKSNKARKKYADVTKRHHERNGHAKRERNDGFFRVFSPAAQRP